MALPKEIIAADAIEDVIKYIDERADDKSHNLFELRKYLVNKELELRRKASKASG